jgi:hypothetical protein
MCTDCYIAVGFVFVPHVYSTILAMWLGCFMVICKQLHCYSLNWPVAVIYGVLYTWMYTEDYGTHVEVENVYLLVLYGLKFFI